MKKKYCKLNINVLIIPSDRRLTSWPFSKRGRRVEPGLPRTNPATDRMQGWQHYLVADRVTLNDNLTVVNWQKNDLNLKIAYKRTVWQTADQPTDCLDDPRQG